MKTLLVIIDMQNDFMEGIGSLPVPGSIKDIKNLIEFINNNKIDTIMCSLDTHEKMQIFHSCWWQDENGNNPEPFTIIDSNSKYKPVRKCRTFY